MKSFTNLIKSQPNSAINDRWLPADLLSNDHQLTEMAERTLGTKLEMHAPVKPNPLDKAISTSEQILQDAIREAEEIRAAAWKEGLQTGMQEAEEKTTQLLDATQAILNETRSWKAQLLKQSETQVMSLVLAIAQKLFGTGFNLDEKDLSELFQRTINIAKPLGKLRVHANPQDIERLESDWDKKQSELTGTSFQFIADEKILPGGCQIHGEYGMVDALLDAQIERILTALKDEHIERSMKET